jgi:hypothetical protein
MYVFQKRGVMPSLTTPQKTNIVVESPPRSVEFPTMPLGAIFSYDGPQKTFPESVYIYQDDLSLLPTSLVSVGDAMSVALGLTGTASAFIDGQTVSYTKEEVNRSFSLAGTLGVVSVNYQRSLVEDDTVIIEGEGKNDAPLLKNLLGLSGKLSLYPVSSETFPSEGVVIRERPAPTTQTTAFGLYIDGAPLLSKTYSKRWVTTVVDNLGAVRLLSFLLPPHPRVVGSTPIISTTDAITNINSNRAALLRASGPEEDLYDQPAASFKNGLLKDYELVYVYKDSSLVPAYIFSGTGTSLGGLRQNIEVLVMASTPKK